MTVLNFSTSPYIISATEITIQNPALWLISHLKIQNLKIQDFAIWFSSFKTFNYYSFLSFNQASLSTQADFSFLGTNWHLMYIFAASSLAEGTQ